MTDTTHNRPKVLAITLDSAIKTLRRLGLQVQCVPTGTEYDAALEQIDNVLDELEAMARE